MPSPLTTTASPAAFTALTTLAVAITVAITGCQTPSHAGDVPSPPTSAVPAGWTVVGDWVAGPDDLRTFAHKLGGRLEALRNTQYDVGTGDRVKINTLVAATAADADSIERSLLDLKPAEFVVRDGTTLYELVGPDSALPQIRSAAAALRAG